MDLLSRTELNELISHRDELCISILMPTAKAGVDVQQSPIRLRNLLDEAQEMLLARGIRSTRATELLAPARELLNSNEFWRHGGNGLAIYISPHLFRSFRLPLELRQHVAVNSRFVVKPLLPLFAGEGMFYILAISQNRLRLLQSTRYMTQELVMEDVPANLAEVLRYDDFEQQRQYHSVTGRVQGARGAIAMHGQAINDRRAQKTEILRYFQQVDRGLHRVLRDETVPLVFAGVEFLLPIFREACSYAHLMPQCVCGNPDREAPESLREKAWALVQPTLEANKRQAVSHFGRAVRAGLGSDDLSEIVPATFAGRVGVLFTKSLQEQWGHFDPATLTLHLHNERQNGDEDLGNLATVQTLLHGGQVYVDESERPSSRPLAAIYRY